MMEGSLASSPMILSAGGQDEQPCDVNNSTTARGSAAWAGRMIATIAQMPSARDQREHVRSATSTAIPPPRHSVFFRIPPAPTATESALVIGRLIFSRYSL